MGAYGTWLMLHDEDELGAPVRYDGSHVVPGESSARCGWLEVGVVPNHVLARRAGVTGEAPEDLAAFKAPFLRLGVGATGLLEEGPQATVVLDQAQVRALADALTAWLEADVAW